MKPHHKSRKCIKRMPLITISLIIIAVGIHPFNNGNNPVVIVSAQQNSWSLTLQITESGGAGNSVVLGGSPNASDEKDDLDLPEPPAPPQFPYVLAWFETPLPVPFDKLLQEYKHYPSHLAVWNLSILWVPEPGNFTSTTISIDWNSSHAAASHYDSLLMYENNAVVANLRIDHSYSFSTNGTLHHFQVIGLSESSNSTSEKNEIPLLPIIAGIIVIIILVVLFFFYRRRKK